MAQEGRMTRVAPIVGAVVVATGLTAAVAWRLLQPASPQVPLAAHALALSVQWRRGELALEQGPRTLAELPVRTAENEAPPLPRFDVHQVEGVGFRPIDSRPALVAGLRLPEGRALLLRLDASAAPLLGAHESRLLDEWSDYAFEDARGAVVVWARAGEIFALAGDVPVPTLRRSLPPPGTAEARTRFKAPEEHFRPPEARVDGHPPPLPAGEPPAVAPAR